MEEFYVNEENFDHSFVEELMHVVFQCFTERGFTIFQACRLPTGGVKISRMKWPLARVLYMLLNQEAKPMQCSSERGIACQLYVYNSQRAMGKLSSWSPLSACCMIRVQMHIRIVHDARACMNCTHM